MNLQNVSSPQSNLGFSLIEVLASIVILSVGLTATARMQMGAIAANSAPIHQQEASTIARDAVEAYISDENRASPRTIRSDTDGITYSVVINSNQCNFAGENLTCVGDTTPATDIVSLYQVTVRNTATNEIVFEMATYR